MNKSRLLRSESDRMISGVCGGIAVYLGVDSVFVRLAFALLALASGVGVILYLVLMFIMPSEANIDQTSEKIFQDNLDQYASGAGSGVKRVRQHPQGPILAAGLLILLGFFLLFNNLGWFAWLSGGVFWALVLIGLGIYIFARSRRNN